MISVSIGMCSHRADDPAFEVTTYSTAVRAKLDLSFWHFMIGHLQVTAFMAHATNTKIKLLQAPRSLIQSLKVAPIQCHTKVGDKRGL